MEKIKFIAVHHSGGTNADPFASTRHHTVKNIDLYHKAKWNMVSKIGYYAGYNFIYDPKTREVIQTRAIGEETMAQIGYNYNTISICIIGNYMKRPVGSPADTVDPMTPEMEEDIKNLIYRLISNPDSFQVVQGTTFDLSLSSVHPHRWFSRTTQCCGTGLTDKWLANLLSEIKEEKIVIIKKTIALILLLIAKLKKAKKLGLRSVNERECSGFTN